MNVFEAFNQGRLVVPGERKEFLDVEWSKHPTFEGVELKHIITSKETDGKYSFHLVKIAPNCSIKRHIHEKQLETHEVIEGFGSCINANETIEYVPGVISIISAGIEHEVNAGEEGLYLFAKFIPALC